jgi:photosystem II stability/assembly factor-like uncharacterized protein
LLRTENGGVTWTNVARLQLPMLTRIKFFDLSNGVVIGYASQAQPAGVFATRDGGDTWQALPTDQAGSWLAGDFLDHDTGAVAGPAGRFATITRRQVVHSPLADWSLRSFHALRLVGPTRGWIVGDGGLLMSTSDAGRSWQSVSAELLNGTTEQFDFHALAVHGQRVWIAGSPGTRVFRSDDAGATWQPIGTGQFTPIRALAFADEQRGSAVGDLGTILTTQDGGCTWQLQRAGGRRAALLGVFADTADVPLELIAHEGAAEGYLTAVNVLHTREDTAHGNDAAKFAATDAILSAGGASVQLAWQFPLPAKSLALTPKDLLAALNRSTDGRAIEQLERHLVRQLRTWRPNVVVTHYSNDTMFNWGQGLSNAPNLDSQNSNATPNSDHLAAFIEQLVLRAVTGAADPNQFVDLSSDAGLTPWRVNKVYGVLPADLHGDERIDTRRFSSALRATPADFVALPRRLVLPSDAVAPDSIELKLLLGSHSGARDGSGIFSGIPLAHGSEARRAAREMTDDDVDALRRMAVKRRRLQELLERNEGNAAWAAQVAEFTDGLDSTSGGELLLQLAGGYRTSGNLDLAADTYFLFARQYPEHPLVDSALVWLVQFYASDEAAHQAAARRPARVDLPITAEHETAVEETEAESSSDDVPRSADGVRQASANLLTDSAAPAVGLSPDDRLRRAIQLAGYLRTARPHLYAEPLVRFAEVTAQRRLGYPNEAKRYFLSMRQLPDSHAWRRCATAEEWLANPGDLPPPKPLATCRHTPTRPQLDGQLDEPSWQGADILRLHGDERAVGPITESNALSSGEVRLSYDQEYFYLAVHCPKAAGGEYGPNDEARPRDADLVEHDRIELRLDLDRDFATAYELAVDHRGWCRDACWGDTNWDPSWYIASAEDETAWTVEAAMPLAALTENRPAAKHVWAVSVRRTIPRVGYESWAGPPTSEDSPDRFGLLIFE